MRRCDQRERKLALLRLSDFGAGSESGLVRRVGTGAQSRVNGATQADAQRGIEDGSKSGLGRLDRGVAVREPRPSRLSRQRRRLAPSARLGCGSPARRRGAATVSAALGGVGRAGGVGWLHGIGPTAASAVRSLGWVGRRRAVSGVAGSAAGVGRCSHRLGWRRGGHGCLAGSLGWCQCGVGRLPGRVGQRRSGVRPAGHQEWVAVPRGPASDARTRDFLDALRAVSCFRSRKQEPSQSGELQCDRHHECHRIGGR